MSVKFRLGKTNRKNVMLFWAGSILRYTPLFQTSIFCKIFITFCLSALEPLSYRDSNWALFKVETQHSKLYYTFFYPGWEIRNKNSKTGNEKFGQHTDSFFSYNYNCSNLYYRPKIWTTLLTSANRSSEIIRLTFWSLKTIELSFTFQAYTGDLPLQINMVTNNIPTCLCRPSDCETDGVDCQDFRPSQGHSLLTHCVVYDRVARKLHYISTLWYSSYCNRWFVFEFRQVLLDENKYTDCVNLLRKENDVLNEGQNCNIWLLEVS
jgi:hypothetical protein